MQLKTVHIQNFRLLENIQLRLEDSVTVIVGRNNSGKTSLTEIFKRLLAETPSFRLEDFSLSSWERFWQAYQKLQAGDEDAEIRKELPYIEVRLEIEYRQGDDTQLLSEFIIDLDEQCTRAEIKVTYCLRSGMIQSLLNGTYKDKAHFYKELRLRIGSHFDLQVEAQDPHDPTNKREIELKVLRRVIQTDFINAQRALDDSTTRDKAVLGEILERLFKAAKSKQSTDDDQTIAQALDVAVADVQDKLDKEFNEQLVKLYPALSLFGYPGLTDSALLTQTVLNVQQLLANHTTVGYPGVNGINLPEPYNGLGSRNLIYILLKLYEYFKEFNSRPTSPVGHLIFIEEPEAHLHPQMQNVFVRQLEEVRDLFEQSYNDQRPWPVQFIVTTHSSHIANEASFDSIRYFHTSRASGDATAQVRTRVKDLRTGLEGEDPGNLEFLHKYMTLTRCDLLFADKAILVEGASERMLLPEMISKVDSSFGPEDAKLGSQYVSTMEVGGAYAHIFFKLLTFLGLKTLVITDLDSVNADGKKCRVSEGTSTSNACIKDWYKSDDGAAVTPSVILSKSAPEKVKALIRLAHQIPHVADDACGRSFEDAFMLANHTIFGLKGKEPNDREAEAWTLAGKIDKTGFALEYSVRNQEWSVPRYIQEGLTWLVANDAPAERANSAEATKEV